jgi:hypothetical protein
VGLPDDRVRKLAKEFDILHFHIDEFHFPLFAQMADRTVTTLHGQQDPENLRIRHRRKMAAGSATVSYATGKGLKIEIEPHDYGNASVH